MLPDEFFFCLACFQDCFTAPSFQRFLTLTTGWILCTSKHTITGVMRAAGIVGKREHGGYHRFFNTAAWSADDVGIVVMKLVLTMLPENKKVKLTIDDTLARHKGRHIAGASIFRDPIRSLPKRPAYHFGHNWVVLAVVVYFPRWSKAFSLPVLARLCRSKKVNEELGRPHRKATELADEMIQLVSETFPDRCFLVIGDNAFVNRSVIRPLPKNIDFLGRGRMDSALYALPPPKRKGRGRPPIRGRKIPSPESRARNRQWQSVQLCIFNKTRTVEVQVFDALWYIVARGRLLRFVLIRGYPGQKKAQVFVTTDLEMSAAEVIEAYCCRWSLEETFGWVKSRLGFEDPQNRKDKAVERTAPMALWTYSLVVYWYAQWSRSRRRLDMRQAPWNTKKQSPSFSDMLATLRRQSWLVWISDQADKGHLDQKDLGPLLDVAGYG